MTSDLDILPVVKIDNDVWVKRDDLFIPFDDCAMNGSKTYQCMSLISSHLDTIKTKHDNTIYSDNFLESPQGPIVARVAKYFGLRCIIPISTPSIGTAMQHRSMQLVEQWGGEIIPVCKMGLALKARATQIYGDRYFRVRFGMSSDMESVRKSVVDPVRNQAKAFIGLPTEPMTLVVAVGSGVVLGSLLVGIADLGIRFKHIIGIQIAGYDRTSTVKKIIESCGYSMPSTGVEPFFIDAKPSVQQFEFAVDKTYDYKKCIDRKIGSIELDSQYEAKAWDWVVKKRLIESGPIMFYIVGNSNCLR